MAQTITGKSSTAFVLRYWDSNVRHERARVFCSWECGHTTLEEPPADWGRTTRNYRVRVPAPLNLLIQCEGCGETLADIAEYGASN